MIKYYLSHLKRKDDNWFYNCIYNLYFIYVKFCNRYLILLLMLISDGFIILELKILLIINSIFLNIKFVTS